MVGDYLCCRDNRKLGQLSALFAGKFEDVWFNNQMASVVVQIITQVYRHFQKVVQCTSLWCFSRD